MKKAINSEYHAAPASETISFSASDRRITARIHTVPEIAAEISIDSEFAFTLDKNHPRRVLSEATGFAESIEFRLNENPWILNLLLGKRRGLEIEVNQAPLKNSSLEPIPPNTSRAYLFLTLFFIMSALLLGDIALFLMNSVKEGSFFDPPPFSPTRLYWSIPLFLTSLFALARYRHEQRICLWIGTLITSYHLFLFLRSMSYSLLDNNAHLVLHALPGTIVYTWLFLRFFHLLRWAYKAANFA